MRSFTNYLRVRLAEERTAYVRMYYNLRTRLSK
jgi:hypothetical protein